MSALQLERQTSPTPSNKSSTATLTSRLSAFSAKLSRTLSGRDYEGEEKDLVGSDIPAILKERSSSRGREFTSSGRGGFGNIRQASLSRDARPDGPDDFSSSRGREPVVGTPEKVFSTGRGGAGNIRSPSREVPSPRGRSVLTSQAIEEEERKREEEVLAHHLSQEHPHSTGRGGLGNITRSRSRDPSTPGGLRTPSKDQGIRSPSRGAGQNFQGVEEGGQGRSRSRSRGPGAVYRSTGRGGAGNMVVGESGEAEALDEAERRKVGGVYEGVHSTGRGGAANLTSTPTPGVEHIPYSHGERESTGRGGAGNIRSGSRTR